MGNRIYVGNLSFHTTENTLRDAFSQFGEVGDVKVVTDRETGRSRGFGFVAMINPGDLRNAISGMDGANVDGRALRVNEAEERQPRQNGGGGGDMRRGARW